ncbi:N-acetylgalactosaminyltransferase [Loa loa]|nr:N-acetylgalactosaminyltransferase [Loa loa]EJD76631.1 N-acetylgalactosaminyltransferase [Loa loa]
MSLSSPSFYFIPLLMLVANLFLSLLPYLIYVSVTVADGTNISKISAEKISEERFTILNDEPKKSEALLEKCPYMDPYLDILSWSEVDSNVSNCDPTTPKEIDMIASEAERKRYEWGIKKFAYDVVTSDKIGPHRKLSSIYHEMCKSLPRNISLSVSIVIIYHNEALSVLIRMLNSIFDHTPSKLLKEIILYDDCSDYDTLLINHVISYGNHVQWPMEKIITRRSGERLGLIKAKVYASRVARGDVLVFLDSHCEVTPLWIEPLLLPIQEDSTRVVLPVVDLISAKTFEFSRAMITKGAFNWYLEFTWKYIPWEYWDIPENNVKPFQSATMSGGLLAIDRKYFHAMGEYDTGMETWGVENIEMSVRIWLCGGSILVAPCSHVGHVFRTHRPYKSKPGMDSKLYNSVRTVKVWFDDYAKYFYEKRPDAKEIEAGDLSERIKLKENLNCKSFQWYVQEIDPELEPKKILHEEL